MSLATRPAEAAQTTSTRVIGLGSALPAHRFQQDEIAGALWKLWKGKLRSPDVINLFHRSVQVDSRHLAFPFDRYLQFSSWGETNRAWLEVAQELGAQALDRALESAGMSRGELDALYVVSITGVASPSLDARLINTMNLRPNIKRTPIFGVGCVGGALGLTRASDHALGYPRQTAAILSVEVCSLTLQHDDLSMANLVSAALFGDGAAAVIVAGADSPVAHRSQGMRRTGRSGPAILGNGSVFYPGSEEIMGWDISEDGFKIVLSPDLPDFIRSNLARDVDAFLAQYGLQRSDIANWVIHTGGPKVLEAIQDSLHLDRKDLERSWDCLRRFGNLSSASVLLVLEDVAQNHRPEPGSLGLLLAMGPGFCSEMLLLQW
jgi:alkylresorcinol/alkylpyrone synthase